MIMKKNIFLSYSKQDEGKLAAIVQKLRQQGLYEDNQLPAIQHEVTAGEDFRKEIKRSISEADTVVIIWTPASANSSWVNYEAGMADALGKRIIVVRPDQNSPTLPANLNSAGIKIVDMKCLSAQA